MPARGPSYPPRASTRGPCQCPSASGTGPGQFGRRPGPGRPGVRAGKTPGDNPLARARARARARAGRPPPPSLPPSPPSPGSPPDFEKFRRGAAEQRTDARSERGRRPWSLVRPPDAARLGRQLRNGREPPASGVPPRPIRPFVPSVGRSVRPSFRPSPRPPARAGRPARAATLPY